jgi:hypothetical protein
MLLGEAAEIEVGKDIAQENQSPEAIVLQHIGRLAGATGLRAKMHVGKDQRVITRRIHIYVVSNQCYGAMKSALKSGHVNTEVPGPGEPGPAYLYFEAGGTYCSGNADPAPKKYCSICFTITS